MRPSWFGWGIGLARAASMRSEDPFYQVGAVMFRPNRTVAGVGYNGAPAGVTLEWQARDERRAKVIHAEVNALRTATLTDMYGGYCCVTHISCAPCLTVMASYKIATVVYEDMLDPLVYDVDLIRSVARTCGITLLAYNREDDSVRQDSV